MGALRDRNVGAALAHIHRSPERDWTNASLVGYESETAFSKAFRRRFGLPAGAWAAPRRRLIGDRPHA